MARPEAQCGTEAGYRRHRRRGEDACPDCKRGAAEARRRRRGAKQPEQDLSMAALAAPVTSDELAETIDFNKEYRRLYQVLNRALPHAMPRECAAIIKEMRALLQDIRLESETGSAQLISIEQGFEKFREAREQAEA